MSRSVEQMQNQIELMLSEIAADQMVFRVTLQCFLLNMVRVTGPQMLGDMKAQVLDSLARSQRAGSDDPQGDDRQKQLTLMRAELLFLELERAAGLVESGAGPSDAN